MNEDGLNNSGWSVTLRSPTGYEWDFYMLDGDNPIEVVNRLAENMRKEYTEKHPD